MPHITLHYTANLDGFDPDDALLAMNRALTESGHFDEEAIKSRALRLDHYRVGVADDERAFVHVQLKVLPGRDEATRRGFAEALSAVLAPLLPPLPLSTQLCIEVDEIDARSYSKRVIDAPIA